MPHDSPHLNFTSDVTKRRYKQVIKP